MRADFDGAKDATCMDANSAYTRVRRLPAVAGKAIVCATIFVALYPQAPSFAAAPDENQGVAEGNRASPDAFAREACLAAWAGDYDQAAKQRTENSRAHTTMVFGNLPSARQEV